MRVVALFVLRVGLALAVDSLDSTEASEVRRALNLDETCQDEDGASGLWNGCGLAAYR